jgi:hypothetical protein
MLEEAARRRHEATPPFCCEVDAHGKRRTHPGGGAHAEQLPLRCGEVRLVWFITAEKVGFAHPAMRCVFNGEGKKHGARVPPDGRGTATTLVVTGASSDLERRQDRYGFAPAVQGVHDQLTSGGGRACDSGEPFEVSEKCGVTAPALRMESAQDAQSLLRVINALDDATPGLPDDAPFGSRDETAQTRGAVLQVTTAESDPRRDSAAFAMDTSGKACGNEGVIHDAFEVDESITAPTEPAPQGRSDLPPPIDSSHRIEVIRAQRSGAQDAKALDTDMAIALQSEATHNALPFEDENYHRL